MLHDEGAGHVGVKSVGVGTEVDGHQVTGFDDAIAGTVVRLGGVRPRGNDAVKAGAFGTEFSHAIFQVCCNIALSTAHGHFPSGQHVFERLRGKRGDTT